MVGAGAVDWLLVNLISDVTQPTGPAFHTSLPPATGNKCKRPVLGSGG